jgi:hypothetical protein
VFVDGEEVHSKLKSGAFPVPQEILETLASRGGG